MSGQRPWAERLALVAVLAGAAALRFAGLTHHLRRGSPGYDERVIFVEPVLRMWRTGSLDPTVYTGYAGLFNHLAAVPIAIGHWLGAEPGAAAGARALVAAFGVMSVGLTFVLGRRYAGTGAGLLAAAMLAVSPLEVRSAHYVTPDVLVGTALLAALFALARGPDRRADMAAGALLAAATAIKYTGLVLAPAIAAERWARGRGRSLGRVGVVAGIVFAVCAPFALLQLRHQGAELAWAFQSYYGRDAAANRLAQGDASGTSAPLLILADALGPVGCALAVASLALFRPRRVLAPMVAVVVTAVVALVPANLVFPRHLVPVAAAATVLVALGWKGVADRLPAGRVRPAVVAALALGALLPPAIASSRLVARYLRKPAVDHAAEWIERNVAAGRVAVGMDRFALDPARFEVRSVRSVRALPLEARRHFDVILANRREAADWAGLTPLATFESEEADAGLALVALRSAEAPAVRMGAPVAVRSSREDGAAAAAFDDDPASVWHAPPGSGWLEARFGGPVEVARVEIDAGPEPAAWPQDLALLGTRDGQRFERLEVFLLRPNRPARQRAGTPHGQAYAVLPPRPLLGLRVERSAGGPWSVAAVRVFALTGRSRSSPSPAAN